MTPVRAIKITSPQANNLKHQQNTNLISLSKDTVIQKSSPELNAIQSQAM